MKGVLFLCVHNAERSQIAAGYMRAFASNSIQVFSAGSQPESEMSPVVVTMGCGDECPYHVSKQYLDWPISDPTGQDMVVVRQSPDEIRSRVEQVIGELVE